jgi:two-component system, cell cycle response regulator DivK
MPRTVLLADDHDDNREALLMVLEASGYQALGARNGAEAVRLAAEHVPDLIVLDLAMPVMDGREALRQIRSDERTRHVPAIMLTAMALSVTWSELEKEGFDGLLIKPCLPFDFLAEIRRRIGPAEA